MRNLRVDAVAFHWYGASTPNNPAGAASTFLNRVEAYHNAYGLPVWITEFAIHDWGNNYTDDAIRQANADFLEIVLPELESREYVERYAFYDQFTDSNTFTHNPLTPTVIGDVTVGTLYPGDAFDLDGVSQGTDVFYVRGGQITNTGPSVPVAMRAIDAIDGVSSIAGVGDWGISTNAEVRVRSNATLRKSGTNTITFANADVQNDGVIDIASGTLQLNGGQLSGSGTVRVGSDATLGLLGPGGRENFLLVGSQLDVEGTVSGPVTLSDGSKLTILRSNAVIESPVLVTNATISVGGDGFNELAEVVPIVGTGLQLNFDAALDTPGDATWSNAVASGADLQFAASASPVSVTDASFPGITAAYAIATSGTAQGLNSYFEMQSPQRSRKDATFEVVFHVSDTNAGSEQVLLEVGAFVGVSMMLSGDTLAFTVDGDGDAFSLSQQLSAGWHHAVGVVDLTGESDNLANDAMTLYVNNVPVGTLDNLLIDDWAGGNISGVGGPASGVAGASNPQGYHGQIAAARYYNGVALSAADVTQNYMALTTAPTPIATTMFVESNLLFGPGAVVELDISDGAEADSIQVAGTLSITGGTLAVSYLGTTGLLAGDQFDLFEAAAIVGNFDDFDLPVLDSGLMWDLLRMSTEGILAVTIAGDYNGDGAVGVADYVFWRETLGSEVTPFTGADGDGSGTIDPQDYAIWRTQFGQRSSPLLNHLSTAVPEPSSELLGLTLIGCLGFFGARARSGRQR